jgi:hypothetical protein
MTMTLSWIEKPTNIFATRRKKTTIIDGLVLNSWSAAPHWRRSSHQEALQDTGSNSIIIPGLIVKPTKMMGAQHHLVLQAVI